MSVTLILAVLIDQWLGEPKKYHPLVLFGQIGDTIEKKFRQPSQSPRQQKLMGLLALSLLIFPFTLFTYLINDWLYSHAILLSSVFSMLVLYFCIAAKSLKQHAFPIFTALKNKQLSIAKQKVSLIVSRQTDQMSAEDVQKATIESILENGADAIFAPIFWFIIAGPAGAILYRLSNTLDAMWGYKNQKYLNFGMPAAKLDDLLNWIPARLTAMSYALSGKTHKAIQCWQTQAVLLDSPNAGPVMTSGAGALNIKLGGPAWYHGNLKNKVFFGTEKQSSHLDINRAIHLVHISLFIWITVLVCIDIAGAYLA